MTPSVRSPGELPLSRERLARFVVVVVGIGLWQGSQAILGAREFPVDEATREAAARALTRGDRVLEWTSGCHAWLAAHRQASSALLVLSSLLIDLVACWLFVVTVAGRTIRPFLGLLLLFSLRQISQWLVSLPAPEGMLWYDPGVPTLLVTYEVANDFFFSGHTALAVYGSIELGRQLGRVGAVAGLGLAAFEVLIVLVLRVHYTMDVFTAVAVAVLAAAAAGRLADPFDAAVARLVGRPTAHG